VRSVEGHRAVLNAIIDRDGRRAKTAMLKHLAAVEQTVLSVTQTKTAGQDDKQAGE
jgi:DNA-binding FadR family transcriptional regulator